MGQAELNSSSQNKLFLEARHLQLLFDALVADGYQVVGPTIAQDAIVYDRLNVVEDLPIGWTDEQEGGKYRLKKRSDTALFGYAVGPHSWKKFLFPSNLRLWQGKREGKGFQILADQPESIKYAFIGVRSCELHAIAIQDRVFINGKYTDPHYQIAREGIFILAINCGVAGGTCFCVSMGTGPETTFGYDLALTEILEEDRHYFVVDVRTEKGAQVFRQVPHRQAQDAEISAAQQVVQETSQHMGRTMDTSDIKELLYRNYEHPRWDNVAQRCLTCTNCTLVCPTCFCHTIEDTTDVSGQHTERWRRWDSCFTLDFSYIHGGSVRSTTRSRYRQWMTHKLATWIDQFGTSGCVGCGRCITWCPVGIDITEEVQAIRDSESGDSGNGKE
jgi:formate hydrogenlyase subunit 6/NADH:ubiquinone oxidoreductase subunit I